MARHTDSLGRPMPLDARGLLIPDAAAAQEAEARREIAMARCLLIEPYLYTPKHLVAASENKTEPAPSCSEHSISAETHTVDGTMITCVCSCGWCATGSDVDKSMGNHLRDAYPVGMIESAHLERLPPPERELAEAWMDLFELRIPPTAEHLAKASRIREAMARALPGGAVVYSIDPDGSHGLVEEGSTDFLSATRDIARSS